MYGRKKYMYMLLERLIVATARLPTADVQTFYLICKSNTRHMVYFKDC